MLVITGIFENERFIPDRPVSLPQNKKVTITVEEHTSEASGTERLIDLTSKVQMSQLMEGSITQSLIGAVPHPDISREEIRTLRLRKYDSAN